MRTATRILLAALALALLGASPANAAFGLKGFSVSFEEEDGTAARLAGSHPFAVNTTFDVNTKDEGGKEVPDGDPKDLRFSFPPGFIGDIGALPRCRTADFLEVDADLRNACPDATAIGISWVQAVNPGEPFASPVYNLVPPPGAAAKIGFVTAPKVPVTAEIGINPEEPNNVVASVLNVSQIVEFYGSSLQIWGVPAAHAHDPYRGNCLKRGGVPEYGIAESLGVCDTGAEPAPFLTMPRSCAGPLLSSYEAVSWQQPGAAPDTGAFAAPGMQGCANLGFTPAISAEPTTAQAESASGLQFGIDIEDEGLPNPEGQAQSDVKDLVVRMPAGMTLNPSAANGLLTCSRGAYEAESLLTSTCPDASKIGEVEVQTPILPEGQILHGEVFLASQDDNPFGSLLALYVVFKDPELGVVIKRAGKVEPSEEAGPNAGQITTRFDGFPQTPFSQLRFRFNQGARAPLITPPACGAYSTEATFTPWSEPTLPRPAVLATFQITSGVGGGPCPPGGVPPFAPGFTAGSLNNAAGAYSPYLMRLTRADGEQNMTRFDAALPRGVAGKLAGIATCPDAAIAIAKAKSGRQELAAPSCPAASEIGHTLVGAGVGGVLTWVPGKLYLGGPLGAAPLSVIAITPAVAGPFDVGTVVVHEALTVDPTTAEVRVDGALSDPLPSLLKGIPVKIRDLRVYADRPGFTFNPTSCAQKRATATLFGSFADAFSAADDQPVALADRYQAASCASLKFSPRLALRLKGGTRRGDHPALRTVLRPRAGEANIHRAAITLPPSEFIDNAHIQNPCTRVQFAAEACPKGSILGRARAFTPVLDEPLEGNVYFRSNGGERLLPDIVLDLRGQIRFTAVGFVDSKRARIRTTFAEVPDAPVSKVVVNLNGGKKGLLVNSRNLCARKLRAKLAYTAHSGRHYKRSPVLKTSCKAKHKKKPKGKKRRR